VLKSFNYYIEMNQAQGEKPKANVFSLAPCALCLLPAFLSILHNNIRKFGTKVFGF